MPPDGSELVELGRIAAAEGRWKECNMSERKKPPVLWADPPQVPTLPKIPILSPTPTGPESALILADRITGVKTHFVGNRTKPCTGDEATCEGCQLGRPARWKGYLPGQTLVNARFVLIEITYEGYRSCPELRGINAQLRGKKITLTRAGKAKNSRVSISVTAAPVNNPNLGTFDVDEALMRIWFGEKSQRKQSVEDHFKATVAKLVHQVGELPAD